MSTLPSVVYPSHGELVPAVCAEDLLRAAGLEDPTSADLNALGEFALNADHLAAIAREAKGIVGQEVLRRMDRLTRWTIHDADLTFKSASPAAGTDVYDNQALAAALAALVEDDVIDQDAATGAIEWVQPPPPAPYWKQKPAGIKALLKLGGRVTEAVLSARVDGTEPPARSVKVTRKGSQ